MRGERRKYSRIDKVGCSGVDGKQSFTGTCGVWNLKMNVGAMMVRTSCRFFD